MKKFLLGILVLFLLGYASCCSSMNKLLKTPDMTKRYYIRDHYKRIAIYHGVNVSNFSKASGENGKADTSWQQPEDFDKISSWGFNLIRHLWHWEAIEPQKDSFDINYVQRQIERIGWARSSFIDVIVDLHQDLFSKEFCGNGFPKWTVKYSDGFGGCKEPWNLTYLDPIVLKNYHHFWNNKYLQDKYVALVDSVFRWVDTIPNVIGVDVMNEPFFDLSGKFERVKLTRLYNRIQEMVRTKGYRKMIFFEPWMSTSAGLPTRLKFKGGMGTVFAPHYYDLFVDAKKPYNSVSQLIMKNALNIKLNEAQKFKCPLFFGEFGATPEYCDYLEDLVNMFDKFAIGWSYYSYDFPQHCEFTFIDENKNPRTNLKVLSRIYPQKIAGTNPTWNINNNTFILKYDKIETDQPTIIFIPKDLNIILVQSDGQYEIIGQYLIYKNSENFHQSIKIVWENSK